MASKHETNVVYGAGVVQGIVLVTFPVASTILINCPRRVGAADPSGQGADVGSADL